MFKRLFDKAALAAKFLLPKLPSIKGKEQELKRPCFFFVLVTALTATCLWLFVSSTSPPLPTPQQPLLFYSNQTRQDIKLTFCTALKQANHSLYLMMYGITDPEVIALLRTKASQHLPMQIYYDKTASSALQNLLPPAAQAQPFSSKGLMHRKILVIDEKMVFLGTANLTTSSLKHHNNLVIGLYSPLLGRFLTQQEGSDIAFELEECQAQFWLLPEAKEKALHHLLETLDQAQKRIQIAMYTLTHPQIADALIRAHQRGVKVQVALDLYTAKGASKKVVAQLQEAAIPLFLSRGQELLHHKWALVDHDTLILGSANWTQAAFSKNEDFLLILRSLPQEQINFLNHLWKIIEVESF